MTESWQEKIGKKGLFATCMMLLEAFLSEEHEDRVESTDPVHEGEPLVVQTLKGVEFTSEKQAQALASLLNMCLYGSGQIQRDFRKFDEDPYYGFAVATYDEGSNSRDDESTFIQPELLSERADVLLYYYPRELSFGEEERIGIQDTLQSLVHQLVGDAVWVRDAVNDKNLKQLEYLEKEAVATDDKMYTKESFEDLADARRFVSLQKVFYTMLQNFHELEQTPELDIKSCDGDDKGGFQVSISRAFLEALREKEGIAVEKKSVSRYN